jgi:hypothetical protein
MSSAEPTSPPSRDMLKVNLAQAAIVIAVLSGLVSLTQAWLILPYRMTAAESKIQTLEAKVEVQNAILIRIDENVKALKRP